uniref:DNA 3'-5' helicase n=1 Tax=Amphimedon queenslandica TaxID=400682 RepID=A0A1X7U272_AMPQE
MARNKEICLIAADEDHLINCCTSFRTEYRLLLHLKSHFPGIPLMALTATATSKVKEKIVHDDRTNTQNFNGTTDYYTCIADYLAEVVGNNRSIVYTNFVKDVAALAIALKGKGINSSSYHGKNLFSHDNLKIIEDDDSDIQASLMVCTSAPGMGIDVPNIDLVVKLGCSHTAHLRN